MAAANYPTGKAIGWGVLIWVVGFAWGSIVFMTPALKNVPSIPFVSRYPVITFPLLIVFAALAYVFAKSIVKQSQPRPAAGVKTGVIFAGLNVLLDLVVIVLLAKGGWEFFAYASIWVAYAMLLLIPIAVGRLAEAWY